MVLLSRWDVAVWPIFSDITCPFKWECQCEVVAFAAGKFYTLLCGANQNMTEMPGLVFLCSLSDTVTGWAKILQMLQMNFYVKYHHCQNNFHADSDTFDHQRSLINENSFLPKSSQYLAPFILSIIEISHPVPSAKKRSTEAHCFQSHASQWECYRWDATQNASPCKYGEWPLYQSVVVSLSRLNSWHFPILFRIYIHPQKTPSMMLLSICLTIRMVHKKISKQISIFVLWTAILQRIFRYLAFLCRQLK